VTLIDRTNHHLFQTLLYQVATGILSRGEIAPPTRDILRRQENARGSPGRRQTIDLRREDRHVAHPRRHHGHAFDSLFVAAGAGTSTSATTPTPSSPRHEVHRRRARAARRIFGAYEMAELTTDAAELDAWLTFVVVGAGPTG
jgi:NADH dehydrogenase